MTPIHYAMPNLDRKGLRNFGLITGSIVAVLFGLFFPWLFERRIPIWPWVLSGVLVGWGLLAPSTLRIVYNVWMCFGLLMSSVTTPIILGGVFFLLITPIAFVRRIFGKDSLPKKFDNELNSYRVYSHNANKNNLEMPF